MNEEYKGKIVYRKWDEPDNPDMTEYYRIDCRGTVPKLACVMAANNAEPGTEDPEWEEWCALLQSNDSAKDIQLVLDDSLPSSREEFITVLAQLYSLSKHAASQIFKD